MSTKRFKDQILSQVLQICGGNGVSKTRVVYASGLNFKTIKPYLIILCANGLIDKIDLLPPLYITTKKGYEVLEHLRALERLIPEFENIRK